MAELRRAVGCRSRGTQRFRRIASHLEGFTSTPNVQTPRQPATLAVNVDHRTGRREDVAVTESEVTRLETLIRELHKETSAHIERVEKQVERVETHVESGRREAGVEFEAIRRDQRLLAEALRQD